MTCKCKYRWPLSRSQGYEGVCYSNCVSCGGDTIHADWIAKPLPPATLDEMADLINYLMHGPPEDAAARARGQAFVANAVAERLTDPRKGGRF